VEYGGRGVSLFFALSGVLICTRLLREEAAHGAISVRSFYTRRLFRIQPAALTYLGALSLLMLAGVFPRMWKGTIGALLMVRNFFPRVSGTWETGHFWTLALEEHFYLFLPGFLVLCKRYRLALMLVLVVAVAYWRNYVFEHPDLQGYCSLLYLRTDIAIDGILLGSIAALALAKPQILRAAKALLVPWVALLYAAVVSVYFEMHHSRTEHFGMNTVYPLVIVATMLHPASLTCRILELAPVRYIGRISYSLYLWQQMFFNPDVVPAPGSFRSHVFLCWCAMFACALASYYLVETPLIRRGHRIAKRFDLLPQ